MAEPTRRATCAPASSGSLPIARAISFGRAYVVSPNGERFLMIEPASETTGNGAGPRIVVVLDWFSELERLVQSNE